MDANMSWKNLSDGGPHEANFLKLDCSKLKTTFDWNPRWDVEKTMEKIVEWTKTYMAKGNISACMDRQIAEFLSE